MIAGSVHSLIIIAIYLLCGVAAALEAVLSVLEVEAMEVLGGGCSLYVVFFPAHPAGSLRQQFLPKQDHKQQGMLHLPS